MLRLYWISCLLVQVTYAANSFSLSDAESQRFIADTSAMNNKTYYSGNNVVSSEFQSNESGVKNTQHMLLEKENNLFNPDGTLGVTKDTKMQINPNGVNFNMGY